MVCYNAFYLYTYQLDYSANLKPSETKTKKLKVIA